MRTYCAYQKPGLRVYAYTENAKLVGDKHYLRSLAMTGKQNPPAHSTSVAGVVGCEPSCPYLEPRACYAMQGPIGWQNRRLDAEGEELLAQEANDRGVSQLQLAEWEAEGLAKFLPPVGITRIHVYGQFTEDRAYEVLAQGAGEWLRRGGETAFLYHRPNFAERLPDPRIFGPIHVRISCSTPGQVAVAEAAGFKAAIVTPEPGGTKPRNYFGARVLDCLKESKGIPCTACRLCWKSNITISFPAHGSRKGKVSDTVRSLTDAELIPLEEKVA